jgi:hypothetical protein
MTVTDANQPRVRRCGRCRRLAPIVRRAADDLPDLCSRCYRQLARQGAIPSRIKRCDFCGRSAALIRRGGGETPSMCERCYREPQDTCSICRRLRPCLHAGTEHAICRSCVRAGRREVCQDCGRMRVIHNRLNGKPQCTDCRRRDLQQRGTCRHCNQRRRLTRIAGLEGLCEPCAGISSPHVCAGCTAEDHLYARGLCARCTIIATLQPHLDRATPETLARLRPYLEVLTQSANPRSTMRWIARSAAYRVLGDILDGRVALDHEALDALGPNQAIEHLRRALVAHRALATRDETLHRFNAWLDRVLLAIEDPRDRQHTTEWARWHLLNGLNYRARRGGLKSRSIYHARSQVTHAVAFINWVHTQGATLTTCRQDHVDRWFAHPSTTRVRVISLLRWAHAQGLITHLAIPSNAKPPAYRTLSHSQRHTLITRLIRDETLDLRDRVAGLLVLLYGQPIARIACLRTTDVVHHDNEILLRLAPEPVVIVEPLATLLCALADSPRGRAVTGATTSPWLFPGKLVGEPLRPERLQRRLAACGVKGLPSRASAVLELAREVPTPVLAETLGYDHDVAAAWARLAAADYARYAASRA